MSKKILVHAVVASLLLSLCAVPAFARAKNALGTWNLDLGKSSYGSMPAPKSEEMTITTDTRDALAWSLKGTTADGKSYTESYDGPIDGQYHPLVSDEPGMTVAYTRAPKGNVTWTIKDKTGAVFETGSGIVARNGKTLTLKGTMQGPNGKSAFVSVFKKAQ
jgi:hypothetical protein